MLNIKEGLKLFRAHLMLSQRDLAVKLGINQRTYAKYETGDTEPSGNTFFELADLGLNIHWLVTGTGDMLLQAQSNSETMALRKEFESRIKWLENLVTSQQETIKNMSTTAQKKDSHKSAA
jgi:transcriptional regulator with XRE-family HTH domain